MDEKSIIKTSYKLCLYLSIFFMILSIVFKDIGLLLGYLLGYMICYIIFQLDIYITDLILALRKAYVFIGSAFLLKMILYSIGFIIAIKIKYFHLASVFVGYLSIKISIYIEGFIKRGGVNNK